MSKQALGSMRKLFPHLPGGPPPFSPDSLSLKCLHKEEDDSRHHKEKAHHRGDGDAYDKGLRHKLLTVLASVPPVRTNPASAKTVSHQTQDLSHSAQEDSNQNLQWNGKGGYMNAGHVHLH